MPDTHSLKEYAQSKEWLRLLHYRKNIFGQFRSDVDGAGYFFSKNGQYDPYEELVASLKAFKEPILIGKLKQPPHCAFPARYKILGKHFGFSVDTSDCKTYQRFLEQFHDPQGVSIVYSSAYPNNPASAFGHTFFKFRSARPDSLLNTGMNFAARVAEDENPFAFFWFGVTGGYEGQWSTQPYYVKVKEYSHFENRDLWEYQLNLSPVETLLLIDHIWELETNSYFYYYFFDENCSFQILAAVEAIKPEWKLIDFTMGLIPGETVKYLNKQPGVISKILWRPSDSTQLKMAYSQLSPEQKIRMDKIISGKADPSSATVEELDLAIHSKNYTKSNDKDAATLIPLLTERAKRGQQPRQEPERINNDPDSNRPDLAHDPYLIAPGFGSLSAANGNRSLAYSSLLVKSPYHDLLNNDAGFSPYGHINFPWIELRAYEGGRYRIEELSFLSTTSLHVEKPFEKKFSFKIDLSLKTLRVTDCWDCHAAHLLAGFGKAYSITNERNLFYALLEFRAEAANGFNQLGPQLEAGMLLMPTKATKAQIILSHFRNLHNGHRATESLTEGELRFAYFLNKGPELRLSFHGYKPKSDVELTQLDSQMQMVWFFR